MKIETDAEAEKVWYLLCYLMEAWQRHTKKSFIDTYEEMLRGN
jgi:hypothetical protein